MVGFIKGIFGAKQAAKTEPVLPPDAAPKLPKPKPEAFYLDSSDAKTLGDIDYMKAAREIKRSFPKTLDGEVPRTISMVSSMERSLAQRDALQRSQATIKAAAPATFASQPSGWATPKADNTPKVKDIKERRRQDSSLDTFRSMARDIQKNNNRSY